MSSYEVHGSYGGKWRVESVYDDKELAVISAQMLIKEAGVERARVVQEVPSTNGKRQYKLVFDSARPSAARPAPARKRAPNRQPAPTAKPTGTLKPRTRVNTAHLPRRPMAKTKDSRAEKEAAQARAWAKKNQDKARAQAKAKRLTRHIISTVVIVTALGMSGWIVLALSRYGLDRLVQ